jgi:hypothetical protein
MNLILLVQQRAPQNLMRLWLLALGCPDLPDWLMLAGAGHTVYLEGVTSDLYMGFLLSRQSSVFFTQS